MLPKERIQAVLAGEEVDRPAVTPIFMAWAAHFVGHSYRDYYLDADVLVKAQVAVTEAFGLDQISAISDPWREASAYGMEFDYPEQGVGKPRAYRLRDPADAESLVEVDLLAGARVQDRIRAVELLAERMGATHSVLGWVEGPMAEYADLRGVENTLMDLIDKPDLFGRACEILVENAIRFARVQIEAGADMIGVGDAAASLIGPDLYSRYVLPWEQKQIHGIHEAGGTVKLHICGNVTSLLPYLPQTGADVIDLDWMVPLDKARQVVGPDVVLAGNFDPTAILLQGTPDEVARAARECLDLAGPRLILQPGCEVPQSTPEANIRAFCPCRGTLLGDILNRPGL